MEVRVIFLVRILTDTLKFVGARPELFRTFLGRHRILYSLMLEDCFAPQFSLCAHASSRFSRGSASQGPRGSWGGLVPNIWRLKTDTQHRHTHIATPLRTKVPRVVWGRATSLGKTGARLVHAPVMHAHCYSKAFTVELQRLSQMSAPRLICGSGATCDGVAGACGAEEKRLSHEQITTQVQKRTHTYIPLCVYIYIYICMPESFFQYRFLSLQELETVPLLKKNMFTAATSKS